jgi:iron complex transport system permease protein
MTAMLQEVERHALRRRTGVWPSDRAARARIAIPALCIALVLACGVSLTAGASDTSALHALLALAGLSDADVSASDRIILGAIRLPRIALGALVGAALAVSGALMQGLFRNPLADPGLAGVSAGAALGAAGMIVLGGTLLAPLTALFGFSALPVAAFGGGLATTTILYLTATRRGRTSVATMLLAGIALGAFSGAATGILVYIADDKQLRDLTFWGLGSLAGSTWSKAWTVGPLILACLVAAPFLGKQLNALALGEAAAGHMGVPVQRLKTASILLVSAMTGAAVAVSGGIGFIGIVVPHIIRLSVGPDHRTLLPASALLGAALLVLADGFARTIVAPAELPIGIVTATAGAPVFLWLLLRSRTVVDI